MKQRKKRFWVFDPKEHQLHEFTSRRSREEWVAYMTEAWRRTHGHVVYDNGRVRQLQHRIKEMEKSERFVAALGGG